MKYGLREIVQPSSDQQAFRTMPQEATLQIKNNETGETESFDEFKAMYFE